MHLANVGATSDFLQQARNLLADEARSLSQLCYTARFDEAMARQGVEIQDLQTGSRLNEQRKVSLLAAVLQEQDALQNAGPAPLLPAEILKQQLEQRFADCVEKQRENCEHRHQVLMTCITLEELQRARNDQKALDEKEREQRVKVRDDALSAQAQERARSCETHRRLTYGRAVEIANDRVADREAFIAEQEQRSSRCLAEVHEAQARKRQSLMERFEFVQAAVETAHRNEEARAQELDNRLALKSTRSQNHQEECRALRQAEQFQRFEKVYELEHQVQRVQRLKEHHRSEKSALIDRDVEVFQECLALRDKMHQTLHFNAVNAANLASATLAIKGV